MCEMSVTLHQSPSTIAKDVKLKLRFGDVREKGSTEVLMHDTSAKDVTLN